MKWKIHCLDIINAPLLLPPEKEKEDEVFFVIPEKQSNMTTKYKTALRERADCFVPRNDGKMKWKTMWKIHCPDI